jgi:hypothetical protein
MHRRTQLGNELQTGLREIDRRIVEVRETRQIVGRTAGASPRYKPVRIQADRTEIQTEALIEERDRELEGDKSPRRRRRLQM